MHSEKSYEIYFSGRKTMKIKLIQPKMTLRPMDTVFKRVMSPTLALITIAGLTPEEHEVYLEDENVKEINFNDNPDLVAMTMNVDSSKRAYEIALVYKNRNITTIAGGIHASANPDEVLEYFDSVCIGEAELNWKVILDDFQNGMLKKKYFQKEPVDLSLMPNTRWNVIEKDNYIYTNLVSTSRGCPHTCEFCYNSCDFLFNRTRNRPIKSVIQDIKSLGTKHVTFIDDNFIGNIKWTKEFLKEIKPLNITFNAGVTTNIIEHVDLLDEMVKCGCKGLFIGFESINEKSIKSATKFQNKVESYEKLINYCHSLGILINASLVFGFDDDYPDVFKNTLEWLVKNKIGTITAHILTPYPGTKLYKRLINEGRIIDYDNTHYNSSYVVFQPKNMTCDELKNGYLWLYKKFYSYKNIIKRMPECKSQKMPYLLFNLLYRKYGKFTSRLGQMGLMNTFGKLARKMAYNTD